MGRLKNGINGPFKGKIGTVVGINWRGEEIVRSAPGLWTKPPTPAQLKQRKVMAMISSWLKPLKELILIGYQVYSGKKTPMNMAISFTMKEALKVEDGVKTIDYPKAVFSRGELIISWIIEILTLVDALVHIKWENTAPSTFNKETDLANFIIYNPVKEQFVTFENMALRSDKEAGLQLPKNFSGDFVHCYMHYVSEAGDSVSTTNYLGEIQIG